jgi:hypothetical protein
MRWGGQEKTGKHIPIISKKMFDMCQLVAGKHRNFVIRERKHDFLLRGIIFCAECGQRCTAEYHYDAVKLKKRGGKISYYHCMKRTPCKSPYNESDSLENEVAGYLKNIKFSKGFTDMVARKVKKYLRERDKSEAKERRGYFNQKNALVNKNRVLENRLLDETIDRDVFKRLSNEIQEQLTVVNQKLAELETARKFDFNLLEEVLALTRNIPKTYAQAPKFLKRKYLNFFFDKVYVDKGKVVNTAYSPLIQQLVTQREVILTRNWLRRQDSNLRPCPYRNPLVTKRSGLSHIRNSDPGI